MGDPQAIIELLRENVSCNSGESNQIQYFKYGIQLIYVLPLGLLYLSFMITIMKRKKDRELFDDSFFTLLLADGIITLYFLVSDIGFFRLTSYVRPVCEYLLPSLKDPSYILTPFYTSYLYSQLAKMLSTLAMSVNRYTSVIHPVRHKLFWLRHCYKIIIAIFLIPICFVWPVIIGTTSFLPIDGNSVIYYEHKLPWARTTYGRILIAIPTLLFTVYSSFVTSSKLGKLGGRMKKVEHSMNVATVFTAAGFVLVLILQIVYLVVTTQNITSEEKSVIGLKIIMAGTQVSNDFYMLSVILENQKDRDLFEDLFFTLQLADGIITLFFLVSDTVFIRLTSYVRPICELFVSLLKDPSYILTPYLTLHQYVQLAKMLSTVAMSLNRYTSIVHPVHHKTFWIQHCTKILIAVFTIPLLFVWPVAIGTTSFTPFGGTAIINYERVVPWARTTYVRLIVSVPSFCFTLYSSIVTSSKLRKLGGHMKKVEFSMNMATLFTACGFILVVAVQIAYLADSASSWVENMWLTKIILAATQVSYDFYMLSGPVVLLILDKRMRSSIICCRSSRKSGSRNTTTVVAVQPLPTITNHSGHSS